LSQTEIQPYFSLSSFRTYGSNGKPTVSVSSFNMTSLQFRVYRVNDPERFFRQLEDAHNFGDSISTRRAGKSLLERIHRWKAGLRASIRRSLRAQFTEAPSNHLAFLSSTSRHSGASGKGTQYAETPVLNPQQLVLTFTQPLQSKSRWLQSTVDVPVKDQGVYLVEAVDGGLRAYTLLLVSDTVMISKQEPGKLLSFVVDRTSGRPLDNIRVVALARNQTLEEAQTNADGVAELHPATSWPDDVRVLAHNGRDIAAADVLGGFAGR
jgi:hypothetical protein